VLTRGARATDVVPAYVSVEDGHSKHVVGSTNKSSDVSSICVAAGDDVISTVVIYVRVDAVRCRCSP